MTRLSGFHRYLPIARTSFVVFISILMIAGTLSPVLANPLDELAKEGDEVYKQGNYKKAIELYSRLITSGYEGGGLYYNLANSFYKNGDIPEAILYYERAQKLMPHNKDIRYNLDLAYARTVDRIEAPPRLFFWNWVDALRDMVSPKLLAISAWLLAVVTSILFVIKLLTKSSSTKRILLTGSIVTALLFCAALFLVNLRIVGDHGNDFAIVLVDRIELRSAPDKTSTEVFSLHAGTKVEVIKELERWYEIRLADGRQGWMPAGVCEKI